MEGTALIFDFDGTIADTLRTLIKIGNSLSDEFSFRKIEPHEVEVLKNKTPREIIRHLNIPIMKIPAIIARTKKDLRKSISLIQPVKDIQAPLKSLSRQGTAMGILTSNDPENVQRFLTDNGLNVFDFIVATKRIWNKHVLLRRILKEKRLNPDRVVYIGDEIRDIRAAKKAGVKAASVTWGYNSKAALANCNPDFMIETPDQLLNIV